MFRSVMGLALLLAGSSLSPATSLAQDAKIFGKRESATLARVSLSGNKLVLLIAGPAGSTVVKVYPDLDHQIDDSNARADMLMKIGTELEAALGN